jgi:hypothetical protein
MFRTWLKNSTEKAGWRFRLMLGRAHPQSCGYKPRVIWARLPLCTNSMIQSEVKQE